jgi:2-polyprenyl-6-methoxyphenol hydroxylase-like FAD-dependent oxidoreductase
MRVLIVGGGIAGLTLAALLRQRGLQPQIVEKTDRYGGVGYVLDLWPIGSRILKGLGLYPSLRERSQPMRHYLPCDARGHILRRYDFTAFSTEYGPILGVCRAHLIDVLRAGCRDLDLRLGTSVAALEPEKAAIRATLTSGHSEVFDLVVGCDGVHSRTRDLVFGAVPLTKLGWTGWAWWLNPDLLPADTITEYWAAGSFLGLYPARDALCCFCAVPSAPGAPDPAGQRPERIRYAFGHLGGLGRMDNG